MSLHIFGLKNKKIKCLGLGIFDGFHLGHKLISEKSTAILTFYPHPDIYLGKNKALKMLSTLREQRCYYKNLLVLRFNELVANLTPHAFLDEVVKKIIKPKKIVVGDDFRFGKKHKGNVEFLIEWGNKNNIEIDVVPLFFQNAVS